MKNQSSPAHVGAAASGRRARSGGVMQDDPEIRELDALLERQAELTCQLEALTTLLRQVHARLFVRD